MQTYLDELLRTTTASLAGCCWPTSSTPLGNDFMQRLHATLPMPNPSAPPTSFPQTGHGRGGDKAKTEKMATRLIHSGGLLGQGCARARSAAPPDDAAFLAGVSGGPASAGRFFSPSNDFMQRLHATISCNDTNIGHDTKISGHQARCILY